MNEQVLLVTETRKSNEFAQVKGRVEDWDKAYFLITGSEAWGFQLIWFGDGSYESYPERFKSIHKATDFCASLYKNQVIAWTRVK